MKIRYYVGLAGILLALYAPLQAQTYEQMWNEVETLGTAKDLPQSALAAALHIYEKARAEQNVPQMMKAYLTAMKYRSDITPDSLKQDLAGWEQWVARTTDAADKAVLYSVWGELVAGEDIRRGFDCLVSSLEDKEQLLATPAERYEPLEETGDASRRYFRNNLYDLLARRAIELWKRYETAAARAANQTDKLPAGVNDIDAFLACPIVPASSCDFRAAVLQTYQSLLNAYDTDADRSAWLLTGIEAENYLSGLFPSQFTDEQCHKTFRAWTERYATAEAAPEVYRAWAETWKFPDQQAERLQVVRQCIRDYPRYEGIERLKYIEKEILHPALSLHIDTIYPEQDGEWKVTYKNLSGVTLQLYQVNLPATSGILQNRGEDFERKYAKLQREAHFSLRPTADYLETDTVLSFRLPTAGIYLLKAVPDTEADASESVLFHVTALKGLYRPLPDGTQEMVAVDALSGQPVPRAELVTYAATDKGYQPDTVYRANDEGTVRLDFPKGKNLWYHLRTATDEAMKISSLGKPDYSYADADKSTETVRLYTDRALYRPGQTVQVSGLAYAMQGDSVQVLADKNFTLSLIDANRNETDKREVTTDEFGSFSGQFTLPSPCLTGTFRLKAGNASISIRVEEYKRPSFDVAFEAVKADYQAGDSLDVAGVARTYAGAAVRNAAVQYRITRSAAWFWRTGNGRTAAWEGTTTTDTEGSFHIPVHLESGTESAALPWYETYTVTADVTDGAGETQQGSLSLPLGSTSVALAIKDLPDKWMKGRPADIRLTAVNLSGEPLDVSVAYQVIRTRWQDDGQPEEVSSVLSGTAFANREWDTKEIQSLPSGSYRLKLSATDTQGRECTASQDFILFAADDTRPPVASTDWFYQDGTEFPATLYMGSREKDVCLFYDVFAGKKQVESRRIALSDSVVSFRFPSADESGDGVLVSLAFVKGGRLYEHHVRITRPVPDKHLQLKWTTFRDKLRPGQPEEWQLSVLRPDGSPADARLLATLYDASLDKLYRKHSLPFGLAFPRSVPLTYWHTPSVSLPRLSVHFPLSSSAYPSLTYSRLAVPVMGRQKIYRTHLLFAGNARAVPATADAVQAEETGVQEPGAADTDEAADTEPVSLRNDFAETAFFYPHLRTDEAGAATISFVLPESLTTWRFLGLAHTKDVDYGTLEATATASKEFMVRPNMPRFVRAGDQATLAASLVNLSDRAVQGTIRMELFDPETGATVFADRQPFAVEAASTGQASFAFAVKEANAVLACRVMAEGDAFSDGEQQYLPVLTDKQWVTESVSVTANGEGTHVFPLENLFNKQSATATNKRMTVEFTSHPAWYAVLTLPSVADPLNEDALSWATAYYANALAAYIVESDPRIKPVLESYLKQDDAQGTGASNLQQNADLKDILLEETPWLTEAANETEQRQRIATLFDRNALNSRLEIATSKLTALQDADGAWRWYKGMSGNRYVTTRVMELLARLHAATGADDRLKETYRKGKQYLARQAEEECRRMKEAEKTGNAVPDLSEQALDYLYVCALDGNRENDEVNNYLIGQLANSVSRLNVYGKALGAIVLHQAGKTTQAEAFLQSLMEYSVATPDMGRYFDTAKAPYSWFSYKIPVEVAAMEAVRMWGKDTSDLDEMKRWLLKQKQAQAWDTPIATADAIYALLMPDASDLLADTGGVTLSIGGETIEIPAGDAIGYVKRTLEGDVENLREMIVRKETSDMGWGAVYAQYVEEADRVSEQSQALSVTRQLLKGGEAVDESTPLHVGDKLTIRLTVEADRDMDFVQVKDDRAACLEPTESLSGYRAGKGISYYQVTRDASTRFFIERMTKGTHVMAYEVYVDRQGTYLSGIATARSAYSPELGGHAAGYRLSVE